MPEFVELTAGLPAMVRARNRRLGSPLSPEELGDVVQDAFVALWRKLPEYRGRSSLKTWVYGFGDNEFLKALRRKRRAIDGIDRPIEPWSEPTDSCASPPVDPEVVVRALDSVDRVPARIIRLKHFDGLTFSQIGERLDLPLGTVKSLYYRGIDRLRGQLWKHWKEAIS